MTDEDRSEFDAFVQQLPQFMGVQLDTGVATSTAFYKARRAGWSCNDITYDALWAVRNGGGPGVIVNRLKGLGEHPPNADSKRARSQAGLRPTRVPERYVPEPVAQQLSPAHFAARVGVIKRVAAEKVDADTAEQWMRDEITQQKEEPIV